MEDTLSDILKKRLIVTMPDGSKWAVPVEIIALSRAKYYAGEYGGDVEKSLAEDTIPLFEDDDYQVHDWAAGNMDWKDVEHVAVKLEAEAGTIDYQEGWINGEYEVE